MRHVFRLFAVCATAASLTACVHGPAPMEPPDYAPVVGEPAPPQARLYADCLAQATANAAYRRAHDPETEMIQFTCTGEPARAFHDGLAAWSAGIGSGFTNAGRTYRSTVRVQRDLLGVDYCSTDGRGDYRCSISLNAGPFLRPVD